MSERVTTVLGVDGGGTRTRLVAADGAGRILAAAEGGSINLDDHDRADALAALAAAADELRRRSGRAGAPFDAAFFALGGVLSTADRRAARALAVASGVAPAERIGVHHDAYGALEGGLLGEPGAIVVAGTGSICFGRAADGREAWSGNWGPLIGDDGSGHWLGREALRAAALAYDGRGVPTTLGAAVRARLGIDEMEELLGRIHGGGKGGGKGGGLERADIAALAPMVLEHAAAGDAVARGIVARGCDGLARCAEVVHGDLFGDDPAPLFVIGGLSRSASWTEGFRAAIGRRVPAARFVEPALPPVLGAVRRALALAGRPPTAAVDAALAAGRSGLPDGF